MAQEKYEFEKYEAPLAGELANQVVDLLNEVFGDEGRDMLSGILKGQQVDAFSDTIYVARCDGKLVAENRLTAQKNSPWIGALGQVATLKEHRGHGLAKRLCQWAAEDFQMLKGRAIFLGTGEGIAARVYGRCGWQRLANSNVWARITEAKSPEEFLVDYFRVGRDLPVEICPGNYSYRTTIVPFIVMPHDWVLLDANASMLSTRYAFQYSSEGLYQRYDPIEREGNWFVLKRSDGVVVGIVSAKFQEDGSCWVDAFTHRYYQDKWVGQLYEHATRWAQRKGAKIVQSGCADSDFLKKDLCQSLGFKFGGEKRQFSFAGKDLELLVCEK